MSARLQTAPRYRSMSASDLDAVMAIENAIYTHPWTRGNFRDCLDAHYHCRVLELDAGLTGYSVVSTAAGEAHLLNLSVAADWQGHGYGRGLLTYMTGMARECGALKMFLEVRASNAGAYRLYLRAGFCEIGLRRGYYPDKAKPEDAVVMELDLT